MEMGARAEGLVLNKRKLNSSLPCVGRAKGKGERMAVQCRSGGGLEAEG